MLKSLTALVAALFSLLFFVCLIEVASALVNIPRPKASTIRWTTTNDRRQKPILQQLQASEEAVADAIDVDDDAAKPPLQAAIIEEQQPPQAWKPPSQNSGGDNKIFKIQQPQDLLNFVIQDERLSVVKVYASWCKTCKVFDVRYRKLANQLGDSSPTQSNGQVRFAEMQYDTPANEEMCKLLNATKLPYVLIYKGSRGKVADFQCTPATFQMLIDTVNGLLLSDGTTNENVVTHGVVGNNSTTTTAMSNVTASSSSFDSQPQLNADDSSSSNEVNNLKEQLLIMENERNEMFELMKAQIEVDKEEIEKMINVVKIQKTMIEERDETIQKLSGVIESKDGELAALTKNLNQNIQETKQMEAELAHNKTQVDELTNRTTEAEKTIASLEFKAAIREKEAKDKERQTKALWASWEKQKLMYEEERNSMRKLAALSVKNIKTKVRSLVSRKK
jgi:thiol-disulfide isomerase/thioredoxin